MGHGAGVAIEAHHEIVGHKVAEHLVDVYHLLQVFPGGKLLKGGDKPGLVRWGDIGFGGIKNVGIAIRVIVDVLERHVAAAPAPRPAAKAAALAAAKLHALRRGVHVLRVKVRRELEIPEIHVAGVKVRREFEIPEVPARLRRCIRSGCGLFALRCRLRPIPFLELEAHILHVIAQLHGIRLIQLPIIAAVIPLEEGLLNALHRQV